MRLVLGLAKGTQRPTRPDLMRLVNTELARASVCRMEDPIEDFFIAPIATRTGEYPVFMGTWPHAAFYTDGVLEAFARIAGPSDLEVQASAEALLSLSRAVAVRAGLERRMDGGGTPFATVALPAEQTMARLAAHARWSAADLVSAGIDREALSRFILSPDDADDCLRKPLGSASVDGKPLWRVDGDLLLMAPSGISLAVRAIIIDHLFDSGREEAFAASLLEVQAEQLAESGFARLDLSPTNFEGMPARSAHSEISAGRFVHYEQITGRSADWREHGFFGSLSPDTGHAKHILAGMKRAHDLASARPGYVEGITLYLMGGWGLGERIDFRMPDALRSWRFLGLEVPDAIIMGVSSDATISDLWRIEKLAERVRARGFEFVNMSGPLNLHQWWCDTDHHLLPQDRRGLTSPFQVVIPTDGVFTARRFAAEALDRRAVPFPGGAFRTVVRVNPQPLSGVPEAIYGCRAALDDGVHLGVVLTGERPVWLRLAPRLDDEREAAFQNWLTALHWIDLTVSAVGGTFDPASQSPLLVTLDTSSHQNFEGGLPDDAAIMADLVVTGALGSGEAQLRIGDGWHQGSRHADNRAERHLAAALLEAISLAAGTPRSRAELLEAVIEMVPSTDVRWRHAFAPVRCADVLRLQNLIDPAFRPIPVSAAALVRDGYAITAGYRADGTIVGKENCKVALGKLHAQSLDALLTEIARFDRKQLAVGALAMLQACLADDQHWALTARAVRSIHGPDVDHLVSLEHRAEVNARLRAASMIAEIAASQSLADGGAEVGPMDLDELCARALQHFGYCELIPALHGDRLEPEFIISPTGDLRYDHSFGDATLAETASLMHAEQRGQNVADYATRLGEGSGTSDPLDAALSAALEAEYGAPFERVSAMLGVLLDLAIEAGQGVFLIRRSALLPRLEARGVGDQSTCARLVDRLTLVCRSGWNDIEAGAKANDYDLGRFDRRFSLIGRPLVALDASDDPLLVVAPAVAERAAVHNLSGAFEGALQGDFWTSKEMRSYVGGAANRGGMLFNEQVAHAIGALGLEASPSVAPWACVNHQGTAERKLLGDIDVLAFSADRRCVWVIEAKDIKFCRTLGETARRLSDYRGKERRDGKPDNLLRHLNRVGYVRAHAADLARRYKLAAIPDVYGLVVVDSPQPMAFVDTHASADAHFVRLADVGTIDWSRAPRRSK